MKWEKLTTPENHPDKIKKEIIEPEVIPLRPTVLYIQKTGRVVQYIAVDLAQREDHLNSVAYGVLCCDGVCGKEGEGAPGELFRLVYKHS